MSTVISVEHLSKSYKLGQINTGTFRNDVQLWWARARGKPNPLLRIGETDHGNRAGEEIWALKDVSFTVEQGEVLGIIGRNGAGKSTLLKILSRVTAPTEGRVRVKGRIASLLEVGTGFHPELTGRENVYLNGAILGMTKAEVTRKLDEIIAFAEIEQFVDTPVKRYSSGMYVRLAFAVAAHLDPEILIVDEVLAVGDVEFQRKCLGKMGDVAHEGRTVLFVSHNMGSIRNLCQNTMLLSEGSLLLLDNTESVIKKYLGFVKVESTGIWQKGSNKPPSEVFLEEISARNEDDLPSGTFDSQKLIRFRIITQALRRVPDSQIHLKFTNQEGIPVFTICNADEQDNYQGIEPGSNSYEVIIPANFFYPGVYKTLIAILIPNKKIFDIVENFSFTINDLGHHGTIRKDSRLGLVTPLFSWQVKPYETSPSALGLDTSVK